MPTFTHEVIPNGDTPEGILSIRSRGFAYGEPLFALWLVSALAWFTDRKKLEREMETAMLKKFKAAAKPKRKGRDLPGFRSSSSKSRIG
jgi:hypothetical protein